MAVSAHDVARELRHRLPDLGTTSLHKLLYYCQGWYLAWTGHLMFEEKIEAWDMGPVVATVWRDEDRDRPGPTPSELDEPMQSTIGFVVSRYGRLSARELVDLTHAESPWRKATEGGRRNAEIDRDMLFDHFTTDPEQLALFKLTQELADREEYKRAVAMVSHPRSTPVVDETDQLRALLTRSR